MDSTDSPSRDQADSPSITSADEQAILSAISDHRASILQSIRLAPTESVAGEEPSPEETAELWRCIQQVHGCTTWEGEYSRTTLQIRAESDDTIHLLFTPPGGDGYELLTTVPTVEEAYAGAEYAMEAITPAGVERTIGPPPSVLRERFTPEKDGPHVPYTSETMIPPDEDRG